MTVTHRSTLVVHGRLAMRGSRLRAYPDMTGTERGLIALMTRATVIAVSPSPQTLTA